MRVWGLPEYDDGSLDLLPGLCRLREEANVYALLCEGGGGLAGSLLTQGLADELALFYAPKILGDEVALPAFRGRDIARMADAVSLRLLSTERCGEDLLLRARPRKPGPQPYRR